MKPSDRSLEIAVLGLGQAGANIAAEFQRRGYRSLAFNTARTDFTSLGATLPESQRIHIGLEGSNGAGSDVEHGRECIAANADRIKSLVSEHAALADVVVIAAGLGGGAGSCAADLVELVRELDFPILVLTALPHHHESGINKVNALCAIRDLAQLPGFGWVMIDDAKLARLHHDVPISSYFETINRDIVEPLDTFNRLNDRESIAPIRTLDAEDLRTLLLAGGILNYHSRVLPKLSVDAVLETVRVSLAENPIMPSGSDLANAAYLGIVIEASERALAESPFSLFEEVAEQTKRETGGAAVYLGLYRALGVDDASATVRILSCTPALPSSIGEMMAEAQREAGAIQQKATRHVDGLDLGGLERLRPTPVPHVARSRRGGDANAAAPAPVTAKKAARVANEPAPSVAVTEPAPSVASNPPAARAPATQASSRNGDSGATLPSRGRYERLANAFREATEDDKRSKIGGELVSALQSNEALERFYAVNAMSRVNPGYFKEALRKAARDADRHVSDLARRALEKLTVGRD